MSKTVYSFVACRWKRRVTALVQKHWFKKYDVVPPELQQSLSKAASVPIDVDPIFSFPREVR